jgi:hypothetical protein
MAVGKRMQPAFVIIVREDEIVAQRIHNQQYGFVEAGRKPAMFMFGVEGHHRIGGAAGTALGKHLPLDKQSLLEDQQRRCIAQRQCEKAQCLGVGGNPGGRGQKAHKIAKTKIEAMIYFDIDERKECFVNESSKG